MSNFHNSDRVESLISTVAETAEMCFVKLGRIAWSHNRINTTRQTRRSEEDRKRLIFDLAATGWNPQLGVIATFDERSPIFGNYKDVIEGNPNAQYHKSEELRISEMLGSLEGRRQYRAEMLANPNRKWEIEHFNAGFCDEEGNLIVPDLVNTTCTGRLEAYYHAMLLRLQGSEGQADTFVYGQKNGYLPKSKPIWTVPVQIALIKDEAERIQVQKSENTKREGFVEPSAVDKLATIAKLYKEYSITQAQARRVYPGTVGTKAWLVCELDYLWSSRNHSCKFPNEGKLARPDLNLLDRCLQKKRNEEWLDFKAMNDTSLLARLVYRSNPSELKAANKRLDKERANAVKEGKPGPDTLEPISFDEINSLLRRTYGKGGSGNAKSTMAKKTAWEQAAKRSTESGEPTFVAKMAAEVLDGTMSSVHKMMAHDELFSSAMRAAESGESSHAVKALEIMRHPQFLEFCKIAQQNPGKKLVISVAPEVAPEVAPKVAPEVAPKEEGKPLNKRQRRLALRMAEDNS